MKGTGQAISILKVISLIIIDIITLLIVFSIWAIINIPVFPWALTAILFSLIMLNVFSLRSYYLIQSLGIPSYSSIMIATGLYYMTIMFYTGFVYAIATPRGYLITVLIFTLIYVILLTGLYLSAMNHKEDVTRQEIEQSQVMNVNLQLMELQNAINHANTYIENDQYEKLVKSFESMKERLLSSTPLGRISKPIVIEMETKLNTKLLVLYDEISLLNSASNAQSKYDNIMNDLSDLKTLIINREKLIIQ